MASSSTSSNFQQWNPSILLQRPEKWTSKHLQALRVTQQIVPSETLIETTYLPNNEDGEFQGLAAEFAKPTKDDLVHYADKRSLYLKNVFLPVFLRLHNLTECSHDYIASRYAMNDIFDVLLSAINLTGTLSQSTSSASKIQFTIQPTGVKCSVRCGGAIYSVGHEYGSISLPVITFSIAKNRDSINLMAREVSQILAQVFCAYEQNPRLEKYKAFVLRIDGTIVQLSTATIHRRYMEDLSEDPDRRRDALRLLIGLVRFLESRGSPSG